MSGRAPGPPPDLRVRRCTVRIRRREGWAWGDPGDLVPAVVDAVEAALAEVATRAGTVDADVRITTPVRLSLGAAGAAGPVVDGIDDLVALVRDQVDRVVPAPGSPGREATRPAAPTTTPGPPAKTADADVHAHAGAGLTSVLARWSRDGSLERVVATWSPAVRAAWAAALGRAAAGRAGATQTWSPAALTAIADRVLGPADAGGVAPGASVRFLVVVGALAAAAHDQLPDAEALEVVRRHVGLPPAAAPAAESPAAGPSAPPAADAPVAAAEPVVVPAASATEVVVPALPVLVVLQLHRLGYLAPAGAALSVGGLRHATRVLAALVAGKTLPPPAHGWRREDAGSAAVGLVAGMPPAQLAERLALGSWTVEAMAPLTAILAGLYADDPDPEGLVVTRLDGDGWICGEAGGLPIAWGSGPAELAGLLGQLGAGTPVEADLFADLADRLGERRAAPGLAAEALERHLGAVVGAALGSLAAELWGAPTGPLTALDRLGDLEGRAVAGPDGLVLALPRGQRWLDLRRAGLLDRWSLPWAPGGRWELVTW